MLGALRRHSKSFIIYLLFAMIIVVFVFTFNTGVGRGGGCTPPEVPIYAKVGSHDITLDNLKMGLGILPNFLRTPEGLSFALAAGVDLASMLRSDLTDLTPAQANGFLQAMEMIYLASDEALRMGLVVNPKELAKAMYPESFYKEEVVTDDDGMDTTKKVFDHKSFNSWVTYGLNSSPPEYEDFMRRLLLAGKLQRFMAGVVKVEPLEAELSARARSTKVNLQYVEFRPELFETMVAPDEAQVKKAIAERGEELTAYYDSHPLKFHSDEAFQVAVLFVDAHKEEPKRGEEPAPEPDPTPEEMSKAEKKAAELLDRFYGRAPLFDPNAPIPIDIPSTGSGTIDMKSLDLDKPEPTEPFDRFKELAKRESDHGETSDRSGLILGWHSAADLGVSPLAPEVAAAAKDAKQGALLGPVQTKEGYWLVYVHEKRERRDVSLEEAKPEIAAGLLRDEEAPKFARKKAEEFLKGLDKKKDAELEEALEKFKQKLGGDEELTMLTVGKTGKFSLTTPGYSLPGIGKFEELFKHAFTMNLDKPVSGKVFVNPDTDRIYVVKLTEKLSAPAEIPADELEQEKESLEFYRDLPYFESWLKSLRAAAIERGEISRTEDFNAFLIMLSEQQEAAEQRKAKEAAKEG